MATNEISGAGRDTWQELQPVIRRGHSHDRVFSDWLTVMCKAFESHKTETTEAEYLRVIQPYVDDYPKGQRSIDYFPKALGQLLIETKREQFDVLGNIFEQQITRGHNGQFLTPKDICILMSQLTLGTIEDGQTISDPACGSGRMLIAACKQNANAVFYGKDVDFRCAQQTSLNLMFFNLNGIVEHGNTLTDTLQNVWVTTRSLIWGGALHQLTAEELEQYQEQKSEKMKQILESPKSQKPVPEDPQPASNTSETPVLNRAQEAPIIKKEDYEGLVDLPLFQQFAQED